MRRGTTLRILKYVMNYRYVVLALLVLTLISNVGNLLGPTFAGKAIGAAVGQGQVDFDTVAFYAGCMLAAYLLAISCPFGHAGHVLAWAGG